jgi:hypothetical protein
MLPTGLSCRSFPEIVIRSTFGFLVLPPPRVAVAALILPSCFIYLTPVAGKFLLPIAQPGMFDLPKALFEMMPLQNGFEPFFSIQSGHLLSCPSLVSVFCSFSGSPPVLTATPSFLISLRLPRPYCVLHGETARQPCLLRSCSF